MTATVTYTELTKERTQSHSCASARAQRLGLGAHTAPLPISGGSADLDPSYPGLQGRGPELLACSACAPLPRTPRFLLIRPLAAVQRPPPPIRIPAPKLLQLGSGAGVGQLGAGILAISAAAVHQAGHSAWSGEGAWDPRPHPGTHVHLPQPQGPSRGLCTHSTHSGARSGNVGHRLQSLGLW